jgi:hypothetical protein
METFPWGFAVNTSEDNAMAARSAIIHDDSNADVLLILANIECIFQNPGRYSQVCVRSFPKNTSESRFRRDSG